MNGRPPQPPLVHNTVRGLLNKLTMARFDPISDKIIALVNTSESETGGRTLYEVVRLIFEAAANQEMFSEMYACLCGKVVEKISPNVGDDGILDFEGRPVSGGRLFRKHLINRCLEDFERSWAAKEDARIAKAAVEQNKDGSEGALHSDEYYAVQKSKRQGLGLIKFIGELFKLQMLTERVVHDFVKRLLGNVENPAEEEVEGLCKLLTTVGQDLDTPKASAHTSTSRASRRCP
ncbi:ARM repeat-containing protein [Lentinus tigrinus ALCF2SS1-7]|nr:ARM repeat-containing protein [Lentinus tigrinus ALCF2SS1-7]